MEKNFNQKLLDNLEAEIEQLGEKIKKIRLNKEGGAEYKNLITAYKEVVQLYYQVQKDIDDKVVEEKVEEKVHKNGVPFCSNVNMRGNEIFNLKEATEDDQAVNLGQVKKIIQEEKKQPILEIKREYYEDKKTKKETYYLNNKVHREDGPAFISYYENGNIKSEEYYINGQRHRENGPAIIFYDKNNGGIEKEIYYTNGVESCSPEELKDLMEKTYDIKIFTEKSDIWEVRKELTLDNHLLFINGYMQLPIMHYTIDGKKITFGCNLWEGGNVRIVWL